MISLTLSWEKETVWTVLVLRRTPHHRNVPNMRCVSFHEWDLGVNLTQQEIQAWTGHRTRSELSVCWVRYLNQNSTAPRRYILLTKTDFYSWLRRKAQRVQRACPWVNVKEFSLCSSVKGKDSETNSWPLKVWSSCSFTFTPFSFTVFYPPLPRETVLALNLDVTCVFYPETVSTYYVIH